jgi:2'-5' RNA ligase
MSELHSIWLMPIAEDEAMLAAIVAALAGEFGSEAFSPHLTLAGDLPAAASAMVAPLRQIAAGIGPFPASIEGVRTSEAFFRAFYALFAAQGPLLSLKRRAIEALDPSSLETFMPHVSLAYGVKESALRQQRAEELDRRLTGQPIRFDRLCVVRSAQAIPIAEWAIQESVPLG